MRNYVSNAYNHVNEEKIIEVKILQEDGLAKVTVFNTGKPIPEEDVPRILGQNSTKWIRLIHASMEAMESDFLS